MRTGANISKNSRIENGRGGGSDNAFSRTPQAKDDQFAQTAMIEGEDLTHILDVMANDSGGRAKSLWSLDDGISSGETEASDLLTRDIVDTIEYSASGAHISITADGKVAYTYTPELKEQLLSLSADETLTDTFTYAIQVGNGVLSWATATVEIAGVNDPPVLSGAQLHLYDGEVNMPYMIYERDLLIGFTDPDGDLLTVTDLKITNGTLTKTKVGWLFTPDVDFKGTVELDYNVTDGQSGSIPVSQSFLIMDVRAPQMSSTPWDEGILKVDQDIVLDFNEEIIAGSGSVVISNGTDTRIIDINDTSQVTVTSGKKGGAVIIDPTDDLVLDTNYNIQITSGAILDMAGNAYEGIDNPEILDFMTIVSDPLLNWSEPWDEGHLKLDGNIKLNFDEPVLAGSGAIIISNGTDTRAIDINDITQVTFDGSGGVIINPASDLVLGTNYNIQMAGGVILDEAGFAYAGISDPETLDFKIIGSEPLLDRNNPWDDGYLKADNDIQLYFDEPVVAGSGVIIISNGTDTRAIDINDTTQVTFDVSGGVIINPTGDLVLGTNYNIQMASGVILDKNGYAYDGIHDAEMLNFDVITANPLLAYSDPFDEFTEFQVDSDLRLEFDEMVVAGSGAIIISNGTDTRTIDVNDTSQVIFDDYYGSVIINPAEELEPNTIYNIQMASGVITDPNGHAYAGINNPDTLNFITIPSNPLLGWSNPGDESTSKIDDTFLFYFNERVIPGSGNVIISNGTDTRTIDIHDVTQVMFDGYNGVIIDPTEDLMPGEHYHILIDSGAIIDMAGNGYEGINDPDTLNFTTIDSGPLLQFSTPSDDAFLKFNNNIELSFDEEVMAGSGVIVISNGTDTREIDIHDTSQVTFSDSKVTINPVGDLIVDTQYNIQLAKGVIKDFDGNDYAGINDPDALNFTTLNSDPLLIGSYPYDDEADVWVGSDIQLFFDEMVTPGSGNIIISNGTDTRTIDILDSSQVMFDGYGGVFINPASDLIADANYNVQIDGGAITDMDGNPYAGIHDESTLNFTTTDAVVIMPIFPPFFEPMLL